MKKFILSLFVGVGFFFYAMTASATPVSWDYSSSILQPLRTMYTSAVKVPYIVATSTATSTFAGGISVGSKGYGFADGTFQSTAAGDGTGSVTSIIFSSPLTGGTITTSGTVGIPMASSSADGYLSSTNWSTFNSKAPALGADDNYVTDAQLVVIGNTSGTNTGDNAANTSSANTALSNLGTVAINTSLNSDTDNTDDLGTTLKKWANLFVTTIGATATRVTKGWFIDLEVTNPIAGSITGNAGTASAVAVGGITGLGTGVATALAVNVGSAGAPVVNGGALGTPSSGTVTNLTGTASININGTVGATTPTSGKFTNASSTSQTVEGPLWVTGHTTLANASSSGSITATNFYGALVGNASTASAVAVGGITGLGTGVATALAVNVGSAGAPVVNGGALGTPSSGTVTNLTGTASININGTVGATTPTTGVFTNATTTGFTNLATTTLSQLTTTGNVGIASSTPSNKLTLGSGSITTTENTLATSTTMTVDWTAGNQQLIKTSTAAVAITFSNYVAGQNLKMVVCNPPTGTAGALTFSTAVYWVNKTAPTQTTTANNCDVWSFFSTKATSTTPVIFGAMSPNF